MGEKKAFSDNLKKGKTKSHTEPKKRGHKGIQIGLTVTLFVAIVSCIVGIKLFRNQFHPGWHDTERGRCYYRDYDRVSGKQEIDGKTYFFSEDGYLLNGIIAYDDRLYYAAEDGLLQTGLVQVNGKSLFFLEDGTLCKGFYSEQGKDYYRKEDGTLSSGFVTIDGEIYYLLDDGEMVSGWNTIDGRIYYFNPDNHRMVKDAQTIDQKQFLFDENGVLQVGLIEDDSHMYYAKEDGDIGELGAFSYGWVSLDGTRYYLFQDGSLKTGIVEIENTNWHLYRNSIQYGWFLLENGNTVFETGSGLATGQRQVEGDYYFFDVNGYLLRGWVDLDSGRYFYDEHGVMAQGWTTVDKIRYYFLSDGRMAVGEHVVSGTKYFFSEDGTVRNGFVKTSLGKQYFVNGYVQTGPRTIDGKQYYLDKNGIPYTGMQSIDGTQYCFKEDGTVYSGWKKDGSKTYYFGSDGKSRTGWLHLDKNYYVPKDNVLLTEGVHTIDSTVYMFNADGSVYHGWKTDSGKKYYYLSDGSRKTGWATIGGKKYYFDNQGVMAVNTTMGDYVIDANGVATEKNPVKDPSSFGKITDDNLDEYLASIVKKKGTDIRTLTAWVKSTVPTYSYYSESNVDYYRNNFTGANHQCTKLDRFLAIEAINKGKGACWHYASLMKLVLQAAGYEARVVKGGGHTSREHNWTIVKVNGVWYHIDAMRGTKVCMVTTSELSKFKAEYDPVHKQQGPDKSKKTKYTDVYYYGFSSWMPAE